MKNKKTIILLLLIAIVGVVGLTLAYFSNTADIQNIFSSKQYGTTVTEVFESPDNWTPGTTTDKTLTVTNSGQVDEAVRVSYTETWTSANSNEEGDLPLEQNGNRVALINFSDNGDWTPVTENNKTYYYYNYKLSPGETTSTLLDSVTFNSAITNDSNCTTITNNGTKTITCNSTGNGYDGATYKLTFTIETVQYDKYSVAWGTSVSIADSKQLFCDAFETGELVIYNNTEYYTLKDSNTSDNYIMLIKKDPLTAEEVNTYSTDYVSENGEYSYYESNDCNENDQSGCSTNYDTSSIKKIVDGWSSGFSDDLVSIDGYKAKLLSEYDINSYMDTYNSQNINIYVYGDHPFSNNKSYQYWSTYNIEDSNYEAYTISGILKKTPVYSKYYIRPVINLNKNVLEGVCSINKRNQYFTCNEGDYFKYNNENYIVIKNSDNSKKHVMAIKEYALTAEEVNTYSTDYVSRDGRYPFCLDGSENCDSNYDNSDVKKIVDGWSSSFSNDLIEIDTFKVGFLEGIFFEEFHGGRPALREMIYKDQAYWTSSGNYSFDSSVIEHYNPHNLFYIRPSINLNKNAIQGECYGEKLYYRGDELTYNNNNYCVLENSLSNQDYVTVLKTEPLTYDELIQYNNGYDINRDVADNNIGTVSFYKNDNCYYNSESDYDQNGCSNNYNNSFVKNIVNNWTGGFSDDLISIDGYKVRLLTNSDLINMGHQSYQNSDGYQVIHSEYNCLYSNVDTFMMNPISDSNTVNILLKSKDTSSSYSYVPYAIRPVINLKKCAIDNTCE